MRRLLSFPLFLFAVAPLMGARLDTRVEPHEARVGDRLVLTVTLVPGPGEKPLPFEPPPDWGSFELVAASSSGTVHALTLTTFEVSIATVPALSFRYADAAGRARELRTPEIPVPVKSVLPPDAKDLKGLKGKLRPLSRPVWPWCAAALLAGAAAVFLSRLKKRGVFSARVSPPKPADEEALEALEALDALMAGPAKPYYSRLTDVFRVYIERRFGLPATDRTTAEMIPLLKELPLEAEGRAALRELLETADLAKFARMESAAEERPRHRDRVRAFVLSTRILPPETPS